MKLKIRINELARELEVKPNRILELLPEYGVDEKKTHSSSIDEDVAIAIKDRLAATSGNGGRPSSSYIAEARHEPEEHPVETLTEKEEPVKSLAEPANKTPLAAKAEASTEPTAPVTAPEETSAPVRRVMPIRPPLATSGPREPLRPPTGFTAPAPQPIVERSHALPQAPAPQVVEPPQPPAPPPSPVLRSQPATPAPAMPMAPAPPAARPMPSAPQQPARPAPSPAPPAAGPGRDVPLYRPGQVISNPRPAPEARTPLAPGAPRPAAPAPGEPRPMPPRPAAPSPAPGLRLPQQQPIAPSSRPQLAGQPAARPIVPPRPDVVARLQQQTQPRPPLPGTPSLRPGPPRPGGPMPGQPTSHRGPIRPGQPLVRTGPSGPGMLQNRGARARPMHPTSPMRVEPAVPPPADTQRRAPNKGRPQLEDRRRDAEGKLRPIATKKEAPAPPPIDREITVGEGVTVKELSEKLGVKSSLVIKKLVDRKIFATINQTLDTKLAEEIAREFGASTTMLSYEEEKSWEVELAEDQKDLVDRAPVVTIMGHVDHGKTSLLDAIRLSHVADREAGGITQHIGAYQIVANGKKIVFIDTPGHEAFTRMRARGAKVTDIVILVVSADDGVMPQTIEAIDHARAAKVPIIVAINKIDKPDAQPDRVKQQLADRGLLADDWGGDTSMVPVSAKARTNLDTLLEIILLVAELQSLKANTQRPAVGTVLEAQLDRGRGPVATVLVQNGTLKVGEFFICGQVFGKVRAMYDDLGNQIKEAEPSTPVEVLGLDSLPEVGDNFQVVTDTSKAKQIVMYRETKSREQAMVKGNRITLEQLHAQAKEGDVKDLNIILKTDVGGTAEVLGEMLQKLSTDKIKIRVLTKNVGAITETDVLLASASNAIIIGFNVRPERVAAAIAEKEKVDIRLHTIIYELSDEIKKAMTGLLDPVFKEAFKGRAEVRDVFKITKVGAVAGCQVVEGTLTRNSQVRVIRDNVVVHTGRIESLRRFKDDVSEVKTGFECGVTIASFSDINPGDIFEAFVMERVAAVLS